MRGRRVGDSGGMAGIGSRKELEAWLRDKPPEWAQVIAVRAALRALPVGLEGAQRLPDVPDDFTCAIFRATFIAWTACNFPARNLRTSAVGAKTAAKAAAAWADDNDAIFVAFSACSAEYAAEAVYAINSDAPIAAENAAYPNYHELFRKAVELDCQWLEKHLVKEMAAQIMSWQSLWLDEAPSSWLKLWRKAKAHLLTTNSTFKVWTDWFDRRAEGKRTAFNISKNNERGLNRTILARLADASDEDFWGKGAHHVNTTLQGWIDEARARAAAESPLPEQEDGATAYGLNDAGRVDRLPASDQQHLRDAPDQRRNYADIRDAAQELAEEGQRLGARLRRALDRFLASVPEAFEQAEAYPVWRDGNALRRIHRAHRLVADSREPDDARLDPMVGEMLGGLIDLYNLFAFGDDGLRTLDERRVAAQERARADVERAAAKPLVEAALRAPDMATPRALDDLKAEAEAETLPPGDPYADQAADQASRVRRNWFAALLSGGKRALNELKKSGKSVREGFDREVGKSAFTDAFGGTNIYGPVVQFIRENAQALKHYAEIAYNNSGVAKLIDSILKHWPF